MARPRKHPYEYQHIDRVVYLNQNDPDLFPIKIDILDLIGRIHRYYGLNPPEDFPPLHKIHGYGLDPKDQVFEREVIPETLIKLEKQIRSEVKKESKITAIKIEFRTIDRFWETLEREQDKYAQEIAWLRKIWEYRLLGKFTFINGRVTWLPGNYHFFLNWEHLDDVRPEYRKWDMMMHLAADFCLHDTTTFKNIDPKSRKPIPNEDGEYEMIDLGHRVCAGLNDPKSRRVGDTSRFQNIGMERIIRTIEGHMGTQGRDEPHAKKVFQQQFVRPFEKIPIFFKPLWDSTLGVKPKENMLFDSDSSDFGLHSRVTHALSANAENYNGDRLNYYHRDEAGNCLGLGTPVLMFDGTIKKVEDVVVGDVLMGPDSKPRNVLSLSRGRQQMYRVVPEDGMEWRCNESHILSVYYGNPDDDYVWNTSVRQLINRPEWVLKKCLQYRIEDEEYEFTPFSLIPDGIDDYYGFTIDGDQLFMLGDFTVTHNSPNEDVNKGHKIVKFCLSIGDRIMGFCAYTTTVEEVDAGSAGENYMKLCLDSQYEIRDDNGRTRSWMYNVFIPAEYRLEGFIDKYGDPVFGKPTPEQAKFIGKDYGSIQWIENTVKEYTRTRDWTALAIFQRQYPRKFKDCFSPPGKNQFFPTELIRNQIQHLNFVEPAKKPVRGDFEWTSGFGSDVTWVPNAESGRWFKSREFAPNEINRRRQIGGVWYPDNRLSVVHSADTFGSDQTQGRASLGGLAAYWLWDKTIDPIAKDSAHWSSDRFIVTYKFRPDTVDDFCEDVLKQLIYCGGLIYPERNKDHVEPFLKRNGYDGYLLYDFDHTGNQTSKSAGFYTQDKTKLRIFNFTQKELVKNIGRTYHTDWLEECAMIMDPSQMTRFDLFAACGGCLLAKQNPYYLLMEKAKSFAVNTAGWIPETEY